MLARFGGHTAYGKPAEEIQALIEQLRSHDEHVRWAAAERLATLGAHEAVPALIEHLRVASCTASGSDPRWMSEQAPFIDALKKLCTRDDINTLLDLLSNPFEPKMQLVAIEAVTQLGVREAIPKLYQAVHWGGEIHVQDAAVKALAKLEANELAPLVMRHLAELKGHYAVGAAMVAGALRLREAKPYLLQLLWDNTLYFLATWAVMDALAGLWTEYDRDTLWSLSKRHSDGDVREKAAKVLDKL